MQAYDGICTARLLLREWRESDRKPFAELNADPQVMEHFPARMSRTESDALVDRITAHFAEHGYGLWVVEVDGAPAGFTGLSWTRDLPFSPALEVGWRLARPFWGHGYAGEAATAALSRGFQEVDSIVSFTALTNERSRRVMERVGMRRESEFDHPRLPRGHSLQRHVLYRADAQTWSPHSVLS